MTAAMTSGEDIIETGLLGREKTTPNCTEALYPYIFCSTGHAFWMIAKQTRNIQISEWSLEWGLFQVSELALWLVSRLTWSVCRVINWPVASFRSGSPSAAATTVPVFLWINVWTLRRLFTKPPLPLICNLHTPKEDAIAIERETERRMRVSLGTATERHNSCARRQTHDWYLHVGSGWWVYFYFVVGSFHSCSPIVIFCDQWASRT